MSIQTEASPKPKIERLPPLPPQETVYRPIRKRFHLAFFLAFVAAPFTNLMRFDIPRQRFYFAGFELWISEFAIIFFAMMLLMFVIAASAIIHGRIYCSYACPQMIFSEWSQDVERWGKRSAQRWLKSASAASKKRWNGGCSTECWPWPRSSWPSCSPRTSWNPGTCWGASCTSTS